MGGRSVKTLPPPINLEELVATVDVAMVSSGLATPQSAKRNGIPTGDRRWQIHDPAILKRYMGQAVELADGREELEAIKAIAANSRAPFYAFRSYMSQLALQYLLHYLEGHCESLRT